MGSSVALQGVAIKLQPHITYVGIAQITMNKEVREKKNSPE